MPDERFLHKRLGHSEKVNSLTDLEFRVWTQYQLSADDCGVMRHSAITLQADNDALAARPAKAIQRALDRIVVVGLLLSFEHQGKSYVCQGDWQQFQKVRYPRTTVHPAPTADVLAKCTKETRALFQVRHGEIPEVAPERSGNVPEPSPAPTRAGAREEAHGLRQPADGSRLTAHGGSRKHAPGLLARPSQHGDCLAHGPVCFRPRMAEKYLPRFGGDRAAMVAWAEKVCAEWVDRTERGERVPEGDDFAFWAKRYDESFRDQQPGSGLGAKAAQTANAAARWVGGGAA